MKYAVIRINNNWAGDVMYYRCTTKEVAIISAQRDWQNLCKYDQKKCVIEVAEYDNENDDPLEGYNVIWSSKEE